MWDYLEHSYDPAADVRKAFALLRPGGVLALSTGDAGAPLARISGRRWHLLTPRHHNFFFTRQLLILMLENAGFGAVQTRYEARQATLRSLAYKLRTLAPHSRVVRAGGDWIDHSRAGDMSVTVNMFDVITLVARRPTTAFPDAFSATNAIPYGGEAAAAAGRAALKPKPRAADTEPKDLRPGRIINARAV